MRLGLKSVFERMKMEQKNGAWEKKHSIPIGDLLKRVNETEESPCLTCAAIIIRYPVD